MQSEGERTMKGRKGDPENLKEQFMIQMQAQNERKKFFQQQMCQQ